MRQAHRGRYQRRLRFGQRKPAGTRARKRQSDTAAHSGEHPTISAKLLVSESRVVFRPVIVPTTPAGSRNAQRSISYLRMRVQRRPIFVVAGRALLRLRSGGLRGAWLRTRCVAGTSSSHSSSAISSSHCWRKNSHSVRSSSGARHNSLCQKTCCRLTTSNACCRDMSGTPLSWASVAPNRKKRRPTVCTVEEFCHTGAEKRPGNLPHFLASEIGVTCDLSTHCRSLEWISQKHS